MSGRFIAIGELEPFFEEISSGKKPKAVWIEAKEEYPISYTTFMNKYQVWYYQKMYLDTISLFSRKIEKLENRVKNIENRLNSWAAKRKKYPSKLDELEDSILVLQAEVREILFSIDKKVEKKLNEKFKQEIQKSIKVLREAVISLKS